MEELYARKQITRNKTTLFPAISPQEDLSLSRNGINNILGVLRNAYSG